MRKRKYNLPTYICWDTTCNAYQLNCWVNSVRYSSNYKTLKDAMEKVAKIYLASGKWDMKTAQAYLADYNKYENFDNKVYVKAISKANNIQSKAIDNNKDVVLNTKKRKYNLPKHICWDVTCDLYHANFMINKIKYSFKKKTIKEAMECVASAYYNTGKWDMNRVKEYMKDCTKYETLYKPETRRINDDLNNLPKTKVEMLIQLANEYDHNKDMISLKYKAISTEAVLNALKGNVDGARPDLIYSNEEGSFILMFDTVLWNNFGYPMHILVNRHNVKVVCFDVHDRKTKGIYTIKEFLSFIEKADRSYSVLTQIMADVLRNKTKKNIDKLKASLCAL